MMSYCFVCEAGGRRDQGKNRAIKGGGILLLAVFEASTDELSLISLWTES